MNYFENILVNFDWKWICKFQASILTNLAAETLLKTQEFQKTHHQPTHFQSWEPNCRLQYQVFIFEYYKVKKDKNFQSSIFFKFKIFLRKKFYQMTSNQSRMLKGSTNRAWTKVNLNLVIEIIEINISISYFYFKRYDWGKGRSCFSRHDHKRIGRLAHFGPQLWWK